MKTSMIPDNLRSTYSYNDHSKKKKGPRHMKTESMHKMPGGAMMKDSAMKHKKPARLVKGSAAAKAFMASIRKKK